MAQRIVRSASEGITGAQLPWEGTKAWCLREDGTPL
jgi:hypothetical protein